MLAFIFFKTKCMTKKIFFWRSCRLFWKILSYSFSQESSWFLENIGGEIWLFISIAINYQLSTQVYSAFLYCFFSVSCFWFSRKEAFKESIFVKSTMFYIFNLTFFWCSFDTIFEFQSVELWSRCHFSLSKPIIFEKQKCNITEC